MRIPLPRIKIGEKKSGLTQQHGLHAIVKHPFKKNPAYPTVFSHRYLNSDCIDFKLLYSWLFIDPFEHHFTTQISKLKC